jgi:hypothetical protein
LNLVLDSETLCDKDWERTWTWIGLDIGYWDWDTGFGLRLKDWDLRLDWDWLGNRQNTRYALFATTLSMRIFGIRIETVETSLFLLFHKLG